MSVYSFPTKQVGSMTLDAYASDISASFARIMAASSQQDAHLLVLQEPARALMASMEIGSASPSGFELLADHIRFSNQLLWKNEYDAPYPGKPALDTMHEAMLHAEGFNLDTSEGIAHFQQSLRFAAYNIESTAFNFKNPAFSSMCASLLDVAAKRDMNIQAIDLQMVTPADAAKSLTSVMAFPQLAYPTGFDFRDLFDVMDARISIHGNSHRQQLIYGEDVMLYLFNAAQKADSMTEVRIPLNGVYSDESSGQIRMSVPSVNQYFEHNYQIHSDIPRPTLQDIAVVQHMFSKTADFLNNPPEHIQFLQPNHQPIQLPRQFERLKNDMSNLALQHSLAFADALNPRLSPSMNYNQALDAWKEMHEPQHHVFVVTESYEHAERQGRSDFELVSSLKHMPGVVLFKDVAQANEYMFHVNDVQKGHPYQFSVMLSQVDMRSIPFVDIWQLAALKRTMEQSDPAVIAQLGATQKLNLIKSIAAEQSIHLPEVFEKTLLKAFENTYESEWTRLLTRSISQVTPEQKQGMMQEFMDNAAPVITPERKPTEDNPLPLARPSLRPS